MKVRELVEFLSDVDPDMDVAVEFNVWFITVDTVYEQVIENADGKLSEAFIIHMGKDVL